MQRSDFAVPHPSAPKLSLPKCFRVCQSGLHGDHILCTRHGALTAQLRNRSSATTQKRYSKRMTKEDSCVLNLGEHLCQTTPDVTNSVNVETMVCAHSSDILNSSTISALRCACYHDSTASTLESRVPLTSNFFGFLLFVFQFAACALSSSDPPRRLASEAVSSKRGVLSFCKHAGVLGFTHHSVACRCVRSLQHCPSDTFCSWVELKELFGYAFHFSASWAASCLNFFFNLHDVMTSEGRGVNRVTSASPPAMRGNFCQCVQLCFRSMSAILHFTESEITWRLALSPFTHPSMLSPVPV